MEECASRGADLVCLPENFHYMGRTWEDEIAVAETLKDNTIKKYRRLALENRVWLSLGGFSEKCLHNPKKRYSTSLLINLEGQIVAEYRKLHLFDIDLT